MNVAISTFVRRGYLFTALAVAVLLAGFSGTAWAQATTRTISASASFSPTSGRLEEGAKDGTDTPSPLKVTIKRPATPTGVTDPYGTGSEHLNIKAEYSNDGGKTFISGAGKFAVRIISGGTDTLAGLAGADGTAKLGFVDGDTDGDADREIVLMIDDVEDPGDWLTETLKLTLTKGTVGAADADVSTVETPYVRPFTSTLRVAINDDEALRKPQLKFDRTDIQLAKENDQIVTVLMGVGAGGAGSLPGGIRTTLLALNTDNDRILLSVSPADAVGPSGTDRGIISISGFDVNGADVALEADGQGNYYIGNIGTGTGGEAGSGIVSDNAMTDGIKLKITAKEPSGSGTK